MNISVGLEHKVLFTDFDYHAYLWTYEPFCQSEYFHLGPPYDRCWPLTIDLNCILFWCWCLPAQFLGFLFVGHLRKRKKLLRNVEYPKWRKAKKLLVQYPKWRKAKKLLVQWKSICKSHHFLLSGWQRFLNYGHLTKYFSQYVKSVPY